MTDTKAAPFIKPTVGRIVWFYERLPAVGESKIVGPLAATISHVWDDMVVNLSVLSPNGQWNPVTSVPLMQDGSGDTTISRWCEWMPYQKGQAAKTEQAEAAVKIVPQWAQWTTEELKQMDDLMPGPFKLNKIGQPSYPGSLYDCLVLAHNSMDSPELVTARAQEYRDLLTLGRARLKVMNPTGEMPKVSGDKTYLVPEAFDFGKAIRLLKGGKLVTRKSKGWRGYHIELCKGRYAGSTKPEAPEIPYTVSDVMGSIFGYPTSVDGISLDLFEDGIAGVKILMPFIAKAGFGSWLPNWSPSVTDTLADDWMVVS